MRKLLTLLLLSVAVPALAAQPPANRHQFRIGWGDMLFETLAFHPSYEGTYGNPESLPADFRRSETFDYRYTGHFFAEYQYRITKVFSVGIQADAEGIFWKEGEVDRYHKSLVPATLVKNWDVVVMPTFRFTYLEKPWVRLYSGLGIGALFAFDNSGGFQLAPALNLNLIGIEIGKGPWGGNIEIGSLNSLTDAYHVYLLDSRLISIGAYYKW